MLVIGGSGSLWGATVGALGISLLNSWLSAAENTVHVVFFSVTLPNGASDLILGVLMAAMLLFRPQGVTGGAEFSLAFVNRFRSRRPRTGPEPSPTVPSGDSETTQEQDMQPNQGVESRAER
jgi:branched-chain amino acid transport system permease protein